MLAYAEVLADKSGPVPAALAAHVAQCSACAHDVRAMRSSFAFLRQANAIEPSQAQTNEILMKARKLRNAEQKAQRRAPVVLTLLQGMAYAACLIAFATFTFNAALSKGVNKDLARVGAIQNMEIPPVSLSERSFTPTPESIRKAAEEVQVLSAARSITFSSQDQSNTRHLRAAVDAMDVDIAAAMDALKRDPNNMRATQLVHATLQEQKEALKQLYLHREL